jgi:hypothetical protein
MSFCDDDLSCNFYDDAVRHANWNYRHSIRILFLESFPFLFVELVLVSWYRSNSRKVMFVSVGCHLYIGG